jgi:hypothetical protein
MLLLEQIVFYLANLVLSCVSWLAIALACTAGSVFGGLVWLVCTAVKFFIYTSCFDLVFNTIEYVLTDIAWTTVKSFLYAMIMRRIYDAIRDALFGPSSTLALVEPSRPVKEQVLKRAHARQNAN